MSTTNLFRAFALLALAAFPVSAHSWIEEYQVIDTNGSYIGDRGYSRGYVARTNVTGGYDGFSMDYLVPQTGVRINTSDSLCHPAQRSSNYSNPLYPMLQVAPGNYVAMKYLENGHVTLPWNQEGKPKAAGTVFVYGTTQPADDEKMADVLAWTFDGKGGNGKGWLMTAQNFDDGRCHQINCGNISIDRQEMFPAHVPEQPTSSVEQWCETDLKIPTSQASGTLTTYWVWQWATAPNADCGAPTGKDEYYTTCADFNIIAAGSGNNDAKILAEANTHTISQEAPQSTAVADFMSRTAYTTTPDAIVVDGTKTVHGSIVTAAAAFMSSCSANAGVSAPPKANVPASCDPVTVFTGAAVASASASLSQYATTAPMPAAPAAATSSAPAPASTPASSSSPAALSAAEASTVMVSFTTTTSVTTTVTYTLTSVPLPTTSLSSISASASVNGSSIAFPTISTISAALITPSSTVASSAPASSSASTLAMSSPASPSAAPPAPTSPSAAPSAPSPPVVSSAPSSAPYNPQAAAAAAASYAATQGAPNPAAPTVASNGMVEDVITGADGMQFANEHIVRDRRRHARHFR